MPICCRPKIIAKECFVKLREVDDITADSAQKCVTRKWFKVTATKSARATGEFDGEVDEGEQLFENMLK